jgi:hypothetical protein
MTDVSFRILSGPRTDLFVLIGFCLGLAACANRHRGNANTNGGGNSNAHSYSNRQPMTWYVNGNPDAGKDTNNCRTPGSPCATIGHAVAMARDGTCDKVVIARNYQNGQVQYPKGLPSGSGYAPYRENVVINKNCITLTSVPFPSQADAPVLIETPGIPLTIQRSDAAISGLALLSDDPTNAVASLIKTTTVDALPEDVQSVVFDHVTFGGTLVFDLSHANVGGTVIEHSAFGGGRDLTGGISCRGSGPPYPDDYFLFNTILDDNDFNQMTPSIDERQDHSDPCNIENWMERNSRHLDAGKKQYIDFAYGGGNNAISFANDEFAINDGPLTVISGKQHPLLGTAHIVIRYESYVNSVLHSYPAWTAVPALTPAPTPTPKP